MKFISEESECSREIKECC